jgi:hypothetical protein
MWNFSRNARKGCEKKLVEICIYRPKIMSKATRGDRIRPDLRNLSDPSGSEFDPIQFFKKVKLIRLDPNLTRPDPTRDQIAFNPIEIYQRSEKTQHINWPDPVPTRPDPNPTRSDSIPSKKSNWPDPSDPNPTRTARLPPLKATKLRIKISWFLNIYFQFLVRASNKQKKHVLISSVTKCHGKFDYDVMCLCCVMFFHVT